MAVAALFAAGCKQGNQEPAKADTIQENSCKVIAPSGTEAGMVFCICDKENSMPADLFKGSADDAMLAKLMPKGESKSSINVFLVYNGNKPILVDAGLGEEKGGMMMSGLKEMNVKPEDIEAILLTHLHTDHIGGLLKNGQPVFPRATIYLSVDEFNAWADDGAFGSQNEQWKAVLASYSDRIQPFMDGDTLLDGFAIAHLAPGHTPGHTVYSIGNYLMVGDLLHAQDLQLEHPEFCARYDNDQEQARATRVQWLEYLAENPQIYLCGAHCYDGFVRK